MKTKLGSIQVAMILVLALFLQSAQVASGEGKDCRSKPAEIQSWLLKAALEPPNVGEKAVDEDTCKKDKCRDCVIRASDMQIICADVFYGAYCTCSPLSTPYGSGCTLTGTCTLKNGGQNCTELPSGEIACTENKGA